LQNNDVILKKIGLGVLLFLLCGKVFSQSDSVYNFNTASIFSVVIGNSDSSETKIDEVKIYSLTDANLRIGFKESSLESFKNIDLKSLKRIGYINGNYSWVAAGVGFAGTFLSFFLVDKIVGSDADDNGGSSFLRAAVFIGIPLAAAITGGIVGSNIHKYETYELTMLNHDMSAKNKKVQKIIREGVRSQY